MREKIVCHYSTRSILSSCCESCKMYAILSTLEIKVNQGRQERGCGGEIIIAFSALREGLLLSRGGAGSC